MTDTSLRSWMVVLRLTPMRNMIATAATLPKVGCERLPNSARSRGADLISSETAGAAKKALAITATNVVVTKEANIAPTAVRKKPAQTVAINPRTKATTTKAKITQKTMSVKISIFLSVIWSYWAWDRTQQERRSIFQCRSHRERRAQLRETTK
jgi:hypothetical protein